MMITTPEGINHFRLVSLKLALGLECKGMKHSRGSAYATIKREFNLKGNKQSVLDQFTKIVEANRPIAA